MFLISIRSPKPKPPQIARFLLVKDWRVISLHVECNRFFPRQRAYGEDSTGKHYPIPILWHFHSLDYPCTTIPGPCGPSLWSPFKSSPYSSVHESETKDGCSRSLLSVFCHKKRCHSSFVSCVLWCACLHWWVCSHCKAYVRHIRFSDRCPGLSG